jgi:hypothetical protein
MGPDGTCHERGHNQINRRIAQHRQPEGCQRIEIPAFRLRLGDESGEFRQLVQVQSL